MINMLIPAAIAFLVIFITLGYECYNRLAAKEREFKEDLNKVKDMTSINTDEIRRIKEEIKTLKAKKQ